MNDRNGRARISSTRAGLWVLCAICISVLGLDYLSAALIPASSSNGADPASAGTPVKVDTSTPVLLAPAASIEPEPEPVIEKSPRIAVNAPAVESAPVMAKTGDPAAPSGDRDKSPIERDARVAPFSMQDVIATEQVQAPPDAPDAVCATTVLPTDGGTSGNGRAPSVRYRSIKAVYLITAAELATSGMPSGSNPSGIGWHYSTAPGVAGSGTLVVYLQNTSDTTNLKSTSFASAIVGMTTVHNAATALPNSTTAFDISFSGGSPFTYTGGGLYVAFQWTYAVGTLSTTAVVACNTALTNGLESSQATSGTATDALTASNFRPETRLTVTINNDVSVDYVISYGEVPAGLTGAQSIKAIVTNHGNAKTNVPVTLNITGAESFTDTQTIAALAACNGQTTVSFAPFAPSVQGTDTLTVSVPADDTNANNSKSRPFAFGPNRYSYKHPGTTADGGVGFTGGTGEFVAKFTTTSATQVDSVKLEFLATGAAYRAVIYADSGSGTPGAQLYVDAADRTVSAVGAITIRLPAPVAVAAGNFFVGIQQTGTTNASFSFDNENPIRAGSFYYSTTLNTGPWTDESPGNNFKLNVGVIVGSCLVPLTNSVTPDVASVCAGSPLTFSSAVSGGTGTITRQWTENGSDISGQTGGSTTVTKAAAGSFNYNAKATDDGGCIDVVDPTPSVGTWVGNGGACDDNNACTTGDTCSGSTCAGINPCDDGNACTNDICGTSCTYTAVNCDDNNPCTDDSCNPATGCVHAANTASCSDGNPCTFGDTCSGGTCQAGTAALPSPAHLCNNDAITIPTVGNATPYPSVITPSGLKSYVCKVTVELNGITHTFPDDIDILLARASGNNAIIMSDVGGGTAVTNVTLTLDDAAASLLPDAGPLVSGTFKPTNIGTGDVFSAPAPAATGGSALSAFIGQNPNGAWNLFVTDQFSPDGGSIGTGWCLNITSVCTADAECDDANVCTNDACVNNQCVHTPNTASCDDGNPCTSPDQCAGGVCVPGANPCNDNNACTNDICGGGGSCTYTPVNCDDVNPCTDDSCDPASGCVHVNNASPCSDDNVCTVGDVCAGGVCVPGGPPAAIDFCNGNAIAIPSVGTATPYPTSVNVTAPPIVCSVTVDLNGVTHTFPDDIDVLLSGPAGQNAIVMSDVGGSTAASGVNLTLDDAAATGLPDTGPLVSGTFKPTNIGTGDTFAAPAPAPLGGSALSVFNATNPNGTWSLWVVDDLSGDQGSMSGWCLHIRALCSVDTDCNDGNPCTNDACVGGTCTHTNNTNPCDDGNACTAGDTCTNGACVGGPPPTCDDGDACTADSCNPATGMCDHNAIVCNDNNPCTDDTCVSPGTGCVYTNNNANACSDGNPCTQSDACVGGVCVGSNPVVCDDGNVCTTDACNPATGMCEYANNTNACDDGNPCTTGDVCGPRLGESFDGVTAPAIPGTWSTTLVTGVSGDLPWTTVSTSSDTAPNSAFADDPDHITDKVLDSPALSIASASAKLTFKNRFTLESTFDGGVLEISIGGGAFTDIVAAGGSFASGGYTGTISTAYSSPIQGRQAWTGTSTGYPAYLTTTVNLPAAAAGQSVVLRWRVASDLSVSGTGQNIDSIVLTDPNNVCNGGGPANCDDGNPCTADTCDPQTGCIHTPVVCNDGNVCTDDACDPQSGACVYTNNTASCDDGNACTAGDICGGGTCQPGTPVGAPGEVSGIVASSDKQTYTWPAVLTATGYDAVRGTVAGLPVGPGGGDETCLGGLAGASLVDSSIPPAGTAWWYLARGTSACGIGTYGQQSNGSPRVTTTCP